MKHRFTVTRSESGRPLAEWLRARLKRVMPEVLRLVRQGQVRIDGQPGTDPARRLRPGQQIDARSGRIESYLTGDRGDGRRGSTTKPGEGQRAVTHVRVVEAVGDYTLVECRLETGRTHQVRIHLGEAGTPLCGERVYDRPPHGAPLPDPSGSPRVALHAARLGFAHPATGAWVEWESPLPADLMAVVERLRRAS